MQNELDAAQNQELPDGDDDGFWSRIISCSFKDQLSCIWTRLSIGNIIDTFNLNSKYISHVFKSFECEWLIESNDLKHIWAIYSS
jgi:hypothetical protein